MKKLIFVVCLFSLSVFTQEAEFNGTIKWSELFPVGKRVPSPDIIGQDGNSIYLSRYVKGKRHLEKYNLSTLLLEKSVAFELRYNEKELTLIDQFMFGGKPTLLTNFFNKKTKISYTFLQTIDPVTLEISAPKKISQIYFGIKSGGAFSLLNFSYNFFTRSENEEFGFVLSGDFSETTTDVQISNGDYNYIGILVDGEGSVVAESKFRFPHTGFITAQTKVADNGLVYMLGHILAPDENAPKRIFGNERMKIGSTYMLVLDVETGEINSHDINLEGREIERLTFAFGNNGSINIGGLSSDGGKGVNGSFLLKLDNQFNEVNKAFVDFETDFITTSWSEKKKEDLEKKQDKGKDVQPEFFNYYVDHLISKPDGSSLMLAEQYYVRVVTRTTSNGNGGTTTTTTYYYYYNDIIAVNYDKNGDYLWKKVIKKRQVSTNDYGYYSSYFVVRDENEVHLIYNDREINYVDTEGMSSSEQKALRRSTIGAMVSLDADGEISKQKLFEFEEGGLRLVPKVCGAAGSGFIFLYARSPKGDKVGVIEMN